MSRLGHSGHFSSVKCPEPLPRPPVSFLKMKTIKISNLSAQAQFSNIVYVPTYSLVIYCCYVHSLDELLTFEHVQFYLHSASFTDTYSIRLALHSADFFKKNTYSIGLALNSADLHNAASSVDQMQRCARSWCIIFLF